MQRLAALPPSAADTRQSRAAIERELRWLQARLATAQRIDNQGRTSERVAFGATVTLNDEAAEAHTYRIVGEDEADPDAGLISWTSPLARALLGAAAGDVVTWQRPAGNRDVEIIDIRFVEDA